MISDPVVHLFYMERFAHTHEIHIFYQAISQTVKCNGYAYISVPSFFKNVFMIYNIKYHIYVNETFNEQWKHKHFYRLYNGILDTFCRIMTTILQGHHRWASIAAVMTQFPYYTENNIRGKHFINIKVAWIKHVKIAQPW